MFGLDVKLTQDWMNDFFGWCLDGWNHLLDEVLWMDELWMNECNGMNEIDELDEEPWMNGTNLGSMDELRVYGWT